MIDRIPAVIKLQRVPLDIRKIRQRRMQLGLTQQQAADRAKMDSRQHWNNIETGKHMNINIQLLERIAKSLGMSPGDLLR